MVCFQILIYGDYGKYISPRFFLFKLDFCMWNWGWWLLMVGKDNTHYNGYAAFKENDMLSQYLLLSEDLLESLTKILRSFSSFG